MDYRGGYVSKNLYIKTKESGPLGGCVPGTPASRSANDIRMLTVDKESTLALHGGLKFSIVMNNHWFYSQSLFNIVIHLQISEVDLEVLKVKE